MKDTHTEPNRKRALERTPGSPLPPVVRFVPSERQFQPNARKHPAFTGMSLGVPRLVMRRPEAAGTRTGPSPKRRARSFESPVLRLGGAQPDEFRRAAARGQSPDGVRQPRLNG
ncbi:hypothetical protein APR12_001865 [Nocardia amikacinitolerans]|nr:hypothetical protein [Nocardia amikacinitolerans]